MIMGGMKFLLYIADYVPIGLSPFSSDYFSVKPLKRFSLL